MTGTDPTALPIPSGFDGADPAGKDMTPPDTPSTPSTPDAPSDYRRTARTWGLAAIVVALAAVVSPVLTPIAAPLAALCLILGAIAAAVSDTTDAVIPPPVRAATALVRAGRALIDGKPAQAAAELAKVAPQDWLWLIVLLAAIIWSWRKKRAK